MARTIDDNTLCIWFISIPDPKFMLLGQKRFTFGDCLAQIDRNPDGKSFHLEYRFRYYEDDKAWDSKDRKNWYAGDLHGESEEQVLEKANSVFQTMCDVAQGEIYRHQRKPGQSTESYFEEFTKLPFVHGKKMTKEEAVAQGYATPEEIAEVEARKKNAR